MIDLTGLLSLTSKPNFTDVDLPILQELYYKLLYPNIFEFILSSGETIILKFEMDKFCHLVGTEKTAGQQRNMHRSKLREYKGMRGWNNIQSGALNKASLRGLGVNLNPMRDKVLHFYFLPQLLALGTLMVRYVPTPSSSLKCELFIYDFHTSDNAFIQLGLQKEWHGKWYYPESFMANRVTPLNPTNKQAAPPSTTVAIVGRKQTPRFQGRKIARNRDQRQAVRKTRWRQYRVRVH